MPAVSTQDSVVLVSGANRGIGKSFAIEALAKGAKKVYATARNVASLDAVEEFNDDRVVKLTLDVTNQEQVSAAAAAATDVNVLINNSGIGAGTPLLDTNDEDGIRTELDVNFFGTLKMARAFAPILKANGGGGMANILSVAGLSSFRFAPGYSASKAAGRSLTQALRAELAEQGTLVSGVFPGPVDTDMAANVPLDKVSPESVAAHVFDAMANGDEDIYPDPMAENFAKALAADPKAVEKANAAGF